MGKGSKRRPASISDDEMDERWEAIFKRESRNAEKSRYVRGQRDANKRK